VVCERFGPGLAADQVGEALARGLVDGGAPAPDVCALMAVRTGEADVAERIARQLAAASFDARMLDSRAVIVAARSLAPRTLARSLAFEVATRARQAGVPGYAVAARSRLSSFDARVLDLQVVLEAGTAPRLRRAGRSLGEIV
jgi:hypothetical protein